jgi:hypothetical protein
MKFWKAAFIQAVLFILFGLFLAAHAKPIPRFPIPRFHRTPQPPPMGEGSGRFSFDSNVKPEPNETRAGKRRTLPRPHIPRIHAHKN